MSCIIAAAMVMADNGDYNLGSIVLRGESGMLWKALLAYQTGERHWARRNVKSIYSDQSCEEV